MTHAERNRRWATSHGRKLARRRKYGARVDAGLCVAGCGAPAEPDRVRCAACQAYHREYKQKARDAASRARGEAIGVSAPGRTPIRPGANGGAVAGAGTAATQEAV